jgi:hypothetical protein
MFPSTQNSDNIERGHRTGGPTASARSSAIAIPWSEISDLIDTNGPVLEVVPLAAGQI